MSGSGEGLTLKTWVLSAVVVVASVAGNFSLSWGMKHSVLELSPLALIKVVFTPWILAGIGLLMMWMLGRLTLLSWADLSFVLPVTSVGYVLAALMGRVFLDEQVSWQRWMGTVLIVAGTALVGSTYPRTTQPHGGGR
jgi:uncharacterized membrane protein